MNDNNPPRSQRPRVEWKNGQYVRKTDSHPTATAQHRSAPPKTINQPRPVQRTSQYHQQAENTDFSDFLLGLAHKRSIIVAVLLILAISVGIAMAVTSFSGGDIDIPADHRYEVSLEAQPNNADIAKAKASDLADRLKNGLLALFPDSLNLNAQQSEKDPMDTTLPVQSAVLDGNGYAVCIDPGHGFDDIGTSNDALGVAEKDVVLNVGLALRDKLESAGIRVYMTHDTNIPPEGSSKPYLFGMKKRNGLANSLSDVDLFLSIHCDAYYEDTSVTGVRVYHMKNESDSKGVADEVSQAYVDNGSEKAPIVKEMSGMNSYQVLRDSKIAAVLVETGFVSNTEEAMAMLTDEWIDNTAQSLADAVIRSFEQGIIG